jgi:DNA adenine methylase
MTTPTPEYLQAFLDRLRATLPAHWWAEAHKAARAMAGGRRSSPRVWAPHFLERAGLGALGLDALRQAADDDLLDLHRRLHALARGADAAFLPTLASAHAKVRLEAVRRGLPACVRRDALALGAASPWTLAELASARAVADLSEAELREAHRLLHTQWEARTDAKAGPFWLDGAPTLPTRGLVFPPPHGARLVAGQASGMLRPRKYEGLGEAHLVLSDGKAWGVARFGPPSAVSLDRAARLERRHGLSEPERRRLWPQARSLWYYPVAEAKALSAPVDVQTPRASQALVLNVAMPKEAALAGEAKASVEALLHAHEVVAREMRRRRLPVPDDDALSEAWAEFARRVRKAAGLSLDALPAEVMVVPDFACVVGSAVRAPAEAKDVDVLLRADQKDGRFLLAAEAVEVPLRRLLDPEKAGVLHYVATPQGPHDTYLPLYHLMLVRSSRRGPVDVQKAEEHVFYVHRPVANRAQVTRWAERHGLALEDDLHVTVAYSRVKVDVPPQGGMVTARPSAIRRLGDEGAVVLTLDAPQLEARWRALKDAGATWDHDAYIPHMTLAYDPEGKVAVAALPLPGFDIVLGPERILTDDQVLKAAVAEEGTRGEDAARLWAARWPEFVSRGQGRFVLHAHWRGLSEEEAGLSHEALLRTDHSLHFDLRLEGPGALWGFTVFAGTAAANRGHKGGTRLADLPADDKLQGEFKAEQPKAWLDVGRRAPFVSRPEGVGATPQAFAVFFALDVGMYTVTMARQHAVEVVLRGQKGVASGRFQIVFAPVAGRRRVWLIGRPAAQGKVYADEHDLEAVAREVRTRGQRLLFWREGLDAPLQRIDVRGEVEKARRPFAVYGSLEPQHEALLKMAPPHKRYVEVFAGAGELLWSKARSEEEVLNDLDPHMTSRFRFLQAMTPQQLAALGRRDWTFSWARVKEFLAQKKDDTLPADPVEKFYRLCYALRFSRPNPGGGGPVSIYRWQARHGQTPKADVVSRLPWGKARLQGVKILQKDYREVFRALDGAETFFFCHPPYPGTFDYYNDLPEFNWTEAARLTKGLKGKALWVIGGRTSQSLTRQDPLSEFRRLLKETRLRRPHAFRHVSGANREAMRAFSYLSIFTNYDPADVEGWPLADDEEQAVAKALSLYVPIAKVDDERRLVYGGVLEPGVEDTQGDIATAEAIEEACHRWLARYRVVGEQHHKVARPVEVVECYVAPQAIVLGAQGFRKGTWILGVRVVSDSLWRDVKAGVYTGFSIGGYGETRTITRAEAGRLLAPALA